MLMLMLVLVLVFVCCEGSGSKSFSLAKSWLYCKPRESHYLLELITSTVVKFLTKQIEAGVHVLQLFETWAGELGPALFNEFCFPSVSSLILSLCLCLCLYLCLCLFSILYSFHTSFQSDLCILYDFFRYLLKIAKEIKSRFPSVPLILFPKGAHYAIPNIITSQSFDVLSNDNINPSLFS
jgi:uroporphyrinogen decarboxylase